MSGCFNTHVTRKESVKIELLIERMEGKLFTTISGDALQLDRFGIDKNTFHKLGAEIEMTVQEVIRG